MVIYKFFLKIAGEKSDNEYDYSLDFNLHEEDNPSQKFTPEIRKSMQKALQNKTLCAIKDRDMEKIIRTWIEDIKEGYRESKIKLDLPLLIAGNISEINEGGNQAIPHLIEPELSTIEPCSGMLPPLNFIMKS